MICISRGKKREFDFTEKNAYLRRQQDAKDRMSSSLESMVASSNNVSNIGSIMVFGSLDNSSGWSPPRISANDSKAFRQMTGYWSWLSRMISNTPIKNIVQNLSNHSKKQGENCRFMLFKGVKTQHFSYLEVQLPQL